MDDEFKYLIWIPIKYFACPTTRTSRNPKGYYSLQSTLRKDNLSGTYFLLFPAAPIMKII
jgi:hypothetical protein